MRSSLDFDHNNRASIGGAHDQIGFVRADAQVLRAEFKSTGFKKNASFVFTSAAEFDVLCRLVHARTIGLRRVPLLESDLSVCSPMFPSASASATVVPCPKIRWIPRPSEQ